MMTIDSFLGIHGYSSIKNDMNELGVTSAATSTLTNIVNWLHDEAIPDLNRRLNLARGLQQQSPNSSMVQVDEALVDAMSSEEAEERGAELAQSLNDAVSEGEDIDELMAELEALAYDPDAMAGFYAELGPEAAAIFTANLGQGYAGDNSQAYIELMSIALGTALKDETRPAALYDMNDFWDNTDNPAEAWGRLALLQYGDFSDNQLFVQMTVQGSALDDFTGDDWADPYANSSGYDPQLAPGIELEGDLTALAFQALGNNPEAARGALTSYEPEFTLEDFVDRVYEAGAYPHDRYDVADAFGLAIEAGTGTEGDPPRTEHSEEESEFAFQFINASADHEGGDVPYLIKDSLGRLSASYVHEMVAGSYSDPGERPGFRDGSMTDAPPDFPGNTGLDPSFYLDPETTYEFLGSFQDELHLSMPFDDAVGRLFDERLDAAIQADAAGEGNGNQTQNVMQLFGGLSEMHYLARREYAADFDAQEEARRAGVAQFYSSAAAIVPLPGGWHFAYWGLQVVGNDQLSEWVGEAGGMEDQVVAENAAAESIRWYLTVQALLENGVGTDAVNNAPPGLVENGRLRPMDEIFADEQLTQDFYEWVQESPELNGPADQAQTGWNDGTGNSDTFVGGIE